MSDVYSRKVDRIVVTRTTEQSCLMTTKEFGHNMCDLTCLHVCYQMRKQSSPIVQQVRDNLMDSMNNQASRTQTCRSVIT